jgi:hypothetical protein
MRLTRLVVALALLAGLSAPAAAQTQGKFKFLDGSPYDPQPTLTVSGRTYYTSIYRGQFLSGVPGNPTVDIFCVDFFHSVGTNNEWDAWFSPVSGNLEQTYGMRFRGWTQEIATERYKAAAYLATQFSLADKASWPTYQKTIWNLMGQQTLDNVFTDANNSSLFPLAVSNSTLNDAITGGQGIDASEWTVISGVNATSSSGKQEFLVQQSVVPEPETVILLVTGLLALGAVAYFRGISA